MPASRTSIVYFWFHVEWPGQYLPPASIQSLVFCPALSAYFDIIKNERHGVHVTQLCQDADDDWLSLASNICFMTQHDRLLLAFFPLSLFLSFFLERGFHGPQQMPQEWECARLQFCPLTSNLVAVR